MRIFPILAVITLLAVPFSFSHAQNVIPPITPININSTQDVVHIFQNILDFVFQIAGIVAVGVILYAGIMYMTAGDDQDRRRTATSWLKWGIVGIVVAILSRTIIDVVSSFLTS